MWFLCLCCCLLVSTGSDAFLKESYFHRLPVFANAPLKVSSFNIQVLGKTKLNNFDVINNITKVLLAYDLVSVLELRDSSETVAGLLLNMLNLASMDPYLMIQGARLGRSSSKEAYLFYYKPSRLTAKTVYQYEDVADEFERPPITVVWDSPSTELKQFATLAVHIKPDAAVSELNAMARLAPVLQHKLSVKELFMMGDLNADCTYVTAPEWRNLTLSDPAHFTWLLPQHTDTTAYDTDCAYDNIIIPVQSPSIESYLVPGSARAVNIETEFGLSQSIAQAVSDHYPLEFQLRGQVNEALSRGSQLTQGFSLDMSGLRHSVNDVRELYRTQAPHGFNTTVYRVETRMDHVVLSAAADSLTAVRQRIHALHTQYPQLLPLNQLPAAERLLPGLEALPRVLGAPGSKPLYEVSLQCQLDTSLSHTCSFAVNRLRL